LATIAEPLFDHGQGQQDGGEEGQFTGKRLVPRENLKQTVETLLPQPVLKMDSKAHVRLFHEGSLF